MGKHNLKGQAAPAITLPNFDGTDYTFTPGQNGRPTVLFFYPESGTYVLRIASNFIYEIIPDLQLLGSYGCTKEVCQFRDALSGE